MNYNPAPGMPGGIPWSKERMAKWEIHNRFGFIKGLWWRFMPGAEIEVPWPTGWTEPEPAPGGGFIQFESSDPNDHYRPWLEKNVGRQGWDWEWRIGQIATTTGARDTILIKIRRKKEKYATIAALRWR
jgi:hypothetical protein